jgi:hypothetical protein
VHLSGSYKNFQPGAEGEGCRAFTTSSTDFSFVFLFDRAMIRQFDQIDRHSASPLAQTLGHQTSQQGIEGAFELGQVIELIDEIPQNGLPSGRIFKVLAGLVDGNARGCGKDQDMKEVSDLDLITTRAQGQLGKGVNG